MTDEAERKHDPVGRADEHADALLNAFDEIDRKNRTKNAMVQAGQRQSGAAHVVVLGNEKGGSGKSTAALHCNRPVEGRPARRHH